MSTKHIDFTEATAKLLYERQGRMAPIAHIIRPDGMPVCGQKLSDDKVLDEHADVVEYDDCGGCAKHFGTRGF